MADAFRRGLDELGSFPDRLKMESLAMLAEDAVGDVATLTGMAVSIVSRLRSVDVVGRIPLLYLVDFISKRRGPLGSQFQAAMQPFVADAVMDAYATLPAPQKQKARNMLQTWVEQKVFTAVTPVIYARMTGAGPVADDSAAAPPVKRARLEGDSSFSSSAAAPALVHGHAPSMAGGLLPAPGSSIPLAPQPFVGPDGRFYHHAPAAAAPPLLPAPGHGHLMHAGRSDPRLGPSSAAAPLLPQPQSVASVAAVPSAPSVASVASVAPHSRLPLASAGAAGFGLPAAPVPVAGVSVSSVVALPAAATSGGAAAMGSSSGGSLPKTTAASALGRLLAGLKSGGAGAAAPAAAGGAGPAAPPVPPGVGFSAVAAIGPLGLPVVTPLPPPPPAAVLGAAPVLPEDTHGMASADLSPPSLARTGDGAAANCLHARQPARCSACGARFPSAADLAVHSAAHDAEAAAARPYAGRPAILSRNWWPNADAWVAGGSAGGDASAAASASSSSSAAAAGRSGSQSRGVSALAGLLASSNSSGGAAAAIGYAPAVGASAGAAPFAGANAGLFASPTSGSAAAPGTGRSASAATSDSDGDAIVPADDPSARCESCGEGFERTWHEESEQWVLRGAVAVRGQLHHNGCARGLSGSGSDF